MVTVSNARSKNHGASANGKGTNKSIPLLAEVLRLMYFSEKPLMVLDQKCDSIHLKGIFQESSKQQLACKSIHHSFLNMVVNIQLTCLRKRL